MQIRLHANATVTPAQRRYIYENRHRPTAQLQREMGLTYKTVKRWKNREDGQDASSRPHNINSSLLDWQEALVVDLRTTFLLTLDDLLILCRKSILPTLSRSALLRCLKRHNVNDLNVLMPVKDNGDAKNKKTFKDYEPGYIHVDVKYLPKMPDEENRKYLFVAIDRASRWVYLDIFPDKSAKSAETFLMDVVEDFPGKITKLLTDNGKEFTDRFCRSGMRPPTGNHIFDHVCAQNNIEHRLTKPRSPQTNGMVERFNGRIASILRSTRFKSSQDLKKILQHYLFSYNNVIGQRALKYKTPMKFLALSLNQPNLTDPNIYQIKVADRPLYGFTY